MGQLCAVSFNRYGRLFYLDPGEFRPKVGDLVLVPTDEGAEVAECVWAPEWTDEDTDGFPKLVGLAGADDLRRDEQIRRGKADAKVAAKRLIRAHEVGGAQDEDLVHAADSISFIETNVDLPARWAAEGKCSFERGVDQHRWMYERIRLPRARELARPLYERVLSLAA